MKENWFKVVISLAVIMVAGSATYYFVVYLSHRDQIINNQQSAKIDQDNAQKCAEAGQKYFDTNFSEYKNGGFKAILSGPYFHYNKKIGACLLEYKLMTYDIPINIAPADGNYRFDGYIINLLSGDTEAFVTAFLENGNWKNDFNRSGFEGFENQEMILMQN